VKSLCFTKKGFAINDLLSVEEKKKDTAIPIEDLGLVILDNPQIFISNVVLMTLNENNSAILSCDTSHLPYRLMLPMFSHHTFN
jgi:CRISP-associated protein Cas1